MGDAHPSGEGLGNAFEQKEVLRPCEHVSAGGVGAVDGFLQIGEQRWDSPGFVKDGWPAAQIQEGMRIDGGELLAVGVFK